MHSSMLLSVVTLVGIGLTGCATDADQASIPPTSTMVPPPAPATPGASAAKMPDIEAQRLAAAKNLNLRVVNKDGQELYCRSNYVTASHIQRDETCYTADQLERLQEQAQRQLDQLNNRPNSFKP